MTKEDIERQKGNPDYIEDLCNRILKEVARGDFSLSYIRQKVNLLKFFVDGLSG